MAGGKYPFVHHENGGDEAESRPRRALRLMDVMEPGERSPAGNSAPTKGNCPAVRSGDQKEVMPTAPTILSVTPEGEGETVAVVLCLPPDEGGGASKPRRVRLHLLVEQYAELRGAGLAEVFGQLPGEITPEQADALLEAGELCAAIRRGLGLLQYGDRSAKRLASGLTARGVSREMAASAAEYLTRKGYIHEDDTARVRVRQNLKKGWGPRRIREDLRAKGFGADALEEAMESLTEVDFAENCADVIRKKYGERPADLPSERGERQKMTAALMRLGYDPDHIREALRIIERG